jgi:GT2 family glycosyltransferase
MTGSCSPKPNMTADPLVSIIIVTHNSQDDIVDCVNSVLRSQPANIISYFVHHRFSLVVASVKLLTNGYYNTRHI